MTDKIHKWIYSLHENNQWIICWTIGGCFLGVIPSLTSFIPWAAWTMLAISIVVDRLHWVEIRRDG